MGSQGQSVYRLWARVKGCEGWMAVDMATSRPRLFWDKGYFLCGFSVPQYLNVYVHHEYPSNQPSPLIVTLYWIYKQKKYIYFYYLSIALFCCYALLFCNTSGVPAWAVECPAWSLQQRECPVLVSICTRDFTFNTPSFHPHKDRNLVGRECSGMGGGVGFRKWNTLGLLRMGQTARKCKKKRENSR